MKHLFSNYYGCLMGYAIGDAFGAPIEFMNEVQIASVFGEEGLRQLVIPPNQKYALITDDTQLLMFTCEGLIRSQTRACRKNKERTDEGISIALHRAYLRWLYTQGLQTSRWGQRDYDGWLVKVKRLHAYREPGVTCLTALGKGYRGTKESPINESLGCGCVGRAMPIGLIEEEERVFEIASRSAAITHGHPIAYLSAATLAYITHGLIEGNTILEAVTKSIERLKQEPEGEAILSLIEKAVTLAQEGEPSKEKLESLGTGFVAHEVLAMAIYSALAYSEDYEKAILLAINQSGDSDSVGAITGGILGAYLGIEKIPAEYIQKVELHEELQTLAQDLLTWYLPDAAWLERYPAW